MIDPLGQRNDPLDRATEILTSSDSLANRQMVDGETELMNTDSYDHGHFTGLSQNYP